MFKHLVTGGLAAAVLGLAAGGAMALPEYTVWCGGQSWFGWDDYSECTNSKCSDIGGLKGPVITTASDYINACYEQGNRLQIKWYNTSQDAMGPYKKQ